MTAVIDHAHNTIEDRVHLLSRYYRSAFGWPTTVDPDAEEVRIALGSIVDVLVVRAGLAAEVNNFLIRHMFRAPIIVMPGNPAHWVFLTGRRPTADENATCASVGWDQRIESLVLPEFDAAAESSRWLQRPESGVELPPWSAVLGATRASSAFCGRW